MLTITHLLTHCQNFENGISCLERIAADKSMVQKQWSEKQINVTFSPNKGKYGPEKTFYLSTFHAVKEELKANISNHTISNSDKGKLAGVQKAN